MPGYFVTGVGGQLGYAVMRELAARGLEALGSDIAPESGEFPRYVPLDITDQAAVERVIGGAAPECVIHCAAWTAVDAAEDSPERVFAVNAEGTRNIAAACRGTGAKMIYISTDYVFGGEGETPLEPDSGDFSPLSVYGKSKLAGEQAVRELLDKYFIVRTAWVFGPHGNNFVRTMLRLAETHSELRVVSDQIGTPTYTPDLARLLCDMAGCERYGTYHAVNSGGYVSWCDFAREIFRVAGREVRVVPVTTEEYGAKAPRPRNSRLSTLKLSASGFRPLPDWRDGVKRYIEGENL